MYVKAFVVNVNKRLKHFFLEQHINIVNRVHIRGVRTCRTCFLAALQNSNFFIKWGYFYTILSVFNGKCTGDVVCKPLLI